MMDVFKALYEVPGMCISVEQAVELDSLRDVQSSFSFDVYRQPVLTEKMAEPLLRTPSEGSGRSGLGVMGVKVDEAKVADSGKIV